ncbi:MAG: SIR2 family protein [Promethearchaeota archaeon]
MIFLGAGASKALGIPTMQDFSKIVFNHLSKKGYSDIIKEIQSSLQEFDMTVDFESVYAILEGLSGPAYSVKKAGPFVAFLMKNRNNLPLKKDVSELLIEARKIIYEKCYLSQDKVLEINQLYFPLFELIHERDFYDIINTPNSKGNRRLLGDIIVTTNYDMSLELYYAHNQIRYIDGFHPTANPLIKKFTKETGFNPFGKGSGNMPILIKLHGSIWQFEQKGELIKTIVDPKLSSTPIQIEKEMMIYPTKEKEILTYGYYPFFNLFKNIQWRRLLVIGYSFRDEPVNTAILENLKFDPTSKLILINPNPLRVINNLSKDIPRDRVVLIPSKFGSKETLDLIEDRYQLIR